jgi:modulator of FtsH protease HflK
MSPLFFVKTAPILRAMTEKTSWLARTGALLSANKNPWGGGDSSDSGPGGDGGKPSGPRNPWSQPPSGGKPRGPRGTSSLDQLTDKMRDRFGGGGGFGGGSGGGGPRLPTGPMLRLGLLMFFAFWILFTSIWRISPQERGVVTRFGGYARTLESGIGLTFPWPIEQVRKINVTDIRTLTIPASATETNFVLTGDSNIIDLDYSVRWSIADPELYQFQLADPEKTIQEVADSAMRAAISRASLAGAIGAQRGQIEQDVLNGMRSILVGYRSGVRIEGVAIKRADPPKEVNEAFKDVTAAQQDAQSAINNAKTYAQQVTQRALGEAGAFDRVYEQYRLAPGVTRRRMYYETMEEVLSKVDKTIVETPGVTPYLPLPEVKRRMPEPPVAATAPATTGGVR